jgi:hypothetical protein
MRQLILVACVTLVWIIACGGDADERNGGTNTSCATDASDCLTRQAATPAGPSPTAFFPLTATAQPAATMPAPTIALPSSTPDAPPAGESGISGIVLIGPQCPVVREGEECPDAPYAAIISIRDVTNRPVANTASGADGRFRVVVAPGTYTLIARPARQTSLPAPVSFRVIVAPETFTEVTVSMDSGIR